MSLEKDNTLFKEDNKTLIQRIFRILLYNMNVRIKLTKKVNYTFGDLDLSKLSPNASIEVPLWIALVLYENGYCKIEDDINPEMEAVKIYYLERNSSEITDASNSPLLKLTVYLIKKFRDKKHEDKVVRQVKNIILDIIQIRLQKILKLVSLVGLEDDVVKKMSMEELYLFSQMHSLYNVWVDAYQRILEVM